VSWVCHATPPGWDWTNGGGRLRIENCVVLSETTLSLDHQAPVRAEITLLRNTVTARWALVLPGLEMKPGLSILASNNLFDCHIFLKQGAREGAGDLKDVLTWEEGHNLFGVGLAFCRPESGTAEPRLVNLPAWNRYWNQTNTGSVQLPLRRALPFLPSRTQTMTARDYQLSPAHQDQVAAAGGSRVIPYGAAIELVGPGPAYDTWRRSPEYQQWLDRIRQYSH
jgi:hypothetical protein